MALGIFSSSSVSRNQTAERRAVLPIASLLAKNTRYGREYQLSESENETELQQFQRTPSLGGYAQRSLFTAESSSSSEDELPSEATSASKSRYVVVLNGPVAARRASSKRDDASFTKTDTRRTQADRKISRAFIKQQPEEEFKDDEEVAINVSGSRFLTYRSLLSSVPGTKLANLTKDDPAYKPERKEYFFPRNPKMFSNILDLYHTGELHICHRCCGPSIKKELEYWGISRDYLAPCCMKHYYKHKDDELYAKRLDKSFSWHNEYTEEGTKRLNKYRVKLWRILAQPNSSKLAEIWAVIYLLMVIVTVLLGAADTQPEFRQPAFDFDQLPDLNFTNEELLTHHQQRNPKYIMFLTTHEATWLWLTDLTLNCIFTFELLLHFILSPMKHKFFRSFINVVDIVCLLAFWATFSVRREIDHAPHEIPKMATFLQALGAIRGLRVLRIFRFASKYGNLRVLQLAIMASYKELFMLLVFLFLGMCIFGFVIYYAEFDEPEGYDSVLIGFWWAIVTMTTVGYGDYAPKSAYGRMVGAACALCGLVFVALPIPIVANNFVEYYDYAKMQRREIAMLEKHKEKRLKRLERLKRSPLYIKMTQWGRLEKQAQGTDRYTVDNNNGHVINNEI